MSLLQTVLRSFRQNQAAWLVLAITLALTVTGATFERRAEREREKRIFEEETTETIGRVERRIAAHLATLNGARGLLSVDDRITRARFRSYVSGLELDRLYPGVQALSWAEAVKSEETLEAPVTFIEPLNWRNERALGYDLFSEPTRREALERARDTGLPAGTGKLLLRQETPGEEQPGFVIFAPVYAGDPRTVEERRASLRGWVSAVFRMEDMMGATHYLPSHRKLEIRIYDEVVSQETLLYEDGGMQASFDAGDRRRVLHRTVAIEVAGRIWRIHVSARPDLLGGTKPLWGPLLFSGTVLSLFLFWLTQKLIQSRDVAERAEHRARFLAKAGTKLSASLDYATTLSEVARLSVPFLADVCAFDLLDEEGDIRLVGLAHLDPSKADALRTLREGFTPDLTAANGIARAIQSAETQVLSRIPEDLPFGRAGYVDLLRASRPRSYMCVPVKVRGASIGTLSFVSLDEGRIYDASDVAVVEDLARLVASAVDNARLYRRTDEASRMKDEFLATLSHELRTPLNAILGWARMMRIAGVDERQRTKAVETIERNALLQTQLIADLLDVSRIITGKLRLDARPIDLTRVVEAAVDTIRAAADAKRITIETFLDPESGPVLADASRLQQVAWNFLANAVKFSPDGARITVRVERRDDEVVLAVADTGQGINPAFLPYVFERFRQADSSTTRVHGGLGLGLAIVRHLVELHGGRVTAESAGEGKGAIFTVRLPRMTGASMPVVTTQRDLKPLPQLVGVKVLVVDDELDVRELLLAVLTQSGADAFVAASAAEAIESLQRSPSDVLVSDIAMPHEDGYSLIRRVRALPTAIRGIPALALTAYARDEDVARSLDAGFQKHMSKPVNPIELLEVIASLLPGGGLERRDALGAPTGTEGASRPER